MLFSHGWFTVDIVATTKFYPFELNVQLFPRKRDVSNSILHAHHVCFSWKQFANTT